MYYKKSNSEKTKDLYSKSSIYVAKINEYLTRNNSQSSVVDFNLGEKFLYGRVGRDFVPMVALPVKSENSQRPKFKQFSKTSNVGGTQKMEALSFVVDAFNDLQQQFRKCAAKGQIDPNDKYLSNLVVYKAYQNPTVLFKEYRNGVFNGIAHHFKNKNTNIMNINDFMAPLSDVIGKIAKTTPYTFPAFIKNRRCPINVSGLVVEIADLRADNDEDKVRLFLNSKNWDFYLNACRSYGFMVDKMCPWRLVADIGSSEMMKYASRYGIGATDAVLSKYYTPAHAIYYSKNHFKRDLVTLYNSCVAKNIVECEYCGDGSIILRQKIPTRYSKPSILEQSVARNSIEELYFHIRINEEEIELSESEIYSLKNEMISRNWSVGTMKPYNSIETPAITGFEKIINKPFDYRGSLTYNFNVHLPAYQVYLNRRDGGY
jgi:hypothetical protein